jgi:hypothetical protein
MSTPTIRCSELDRVLACPGSMTLNAIVKHRQGDEGTEGTALHWLSHSRMVSELGAAGNPGATPEMPKSLPFSVWISDFYFAYVRDTLESCPDWSLEVECALAFEWPGFTLSGHIDAVAINPDATEAIGFDLKTGYDPVDIAEQNEQVLGYAVLLLRAYPTLRSITFHIIQPRNDEDEGFQRVSSVTLDGDTLQAAPDSLAARINHAIFNSMEVSTGLKCCKWCSAAPQCPAQILLREHMKATLTPQLLETIKATPDDAALGDWVISGRVINRAMEDAETLLEERIAAKGSVIAGDGTQITIKEQAGSYSFPDPGAFYRATRAVITDDDKYAATVKPSVTKLKDAIAEARGIPKTSKKGESAASVFDGTFRPLCVQGVRKVKVFQ